MSAFLKGFVSRLGQATATAANSTNPRSAAAAASRAANPRPRTFKRALFEYPAMTIAFLLGGVGCALPIALYVMDPEATSPKPGALDRYASAQERERMVEERWKVTATKIKDPVLRAQLNHTMQFQQAVRAYQRTKSYAAAIPLMPMPEKLELLKNAIAERLAVFDVEEEGEEAKHKVQSTRDKLLQSLTRVHAAVDRGVDVVKNEAEEERIIQSLTDLYRSIEESDTREKRQRSYITTLDSFEKKMERLNAQARGEELEEEKPESKGKLAAEDHASDTDLTLEEQSILGRVELDLNPRFADLFDPASYKSYRLSTLKDLKSTRAREILKIVLDTYPRLNPNVDFNPDFFIKYRRVKQREMQSWQDRKAVEAIEQWMDKHPFFNEKFDPTFAPFGVSSVIAPLKQQQQ